MHNTTPPLPDCQVRPPSWGHGFGFRAPAFTIKSGSCGFVTGRLTCQTFWSCVKISSAYLPCRGQMTSSKLPILLYWNLAVSAYQKSRRPTEHTPTPSSHITPKTATLEPHNAPFPLTETVPVNSAWRVNPIQPSTLHIQRRPIYLNILYKNFPISSRPPTDLEISVSKPCILLQFQCPKLYQA